MQVHYKTVKNTILDVKLDKRTECYNFGKGNSYPSIVEALINMSVTSGACIDKVAKAIYGGSLGEVGEIVVNSKGQTLNEVVRITAREYAKHNNFYLGVGYNELYEVASITAIPVKYVRVGKSDSKGYSGKFIVYDNWDKSKGSKILSSGFMVVDRYSNNKAILKAQIKVAGGIKEYNGQIIHVKKDDSSIYSLSDINPVMRDALLEYESQMFRSKGATKGFLNTKLLVTAPFEDGDKRDTFHGELDGARGAENASEVVHLETPQESEDVSKQMHITDLSSPYNDKLFEYSDTMGETNIVKAFGVAKVLVNPTDSSMFGNSGEVLKEAKKQLYESRQEERTQVESVFSELMARYKEPIEEVKILNPYEEVVEEVVEETPEAINAKAQATLRGSVGGVTALLAIQQSVAAGTTSTEAGVAMISNIYGYDEETASEMLGTPKTTNTAE